MKLTSLDPHFLKHTGEGSSQYVETLAEADGLLFLCPRCFVNNNGKVGTHSIICWFAGKVPDDLTPKGRWETAGVGLDGLSFIGPNAASVLIGGQCQAHFYIRNGAIVFC